MSDSTTDKNKPWHKVGRGLKNVAEIFAGVGLPALAGAAAGPLGREVVTKVLKEAGIGTDATLAEIESTVAESNPEILVELRRVELQFLEAQNNVILTREEADTRRIESVNETIRAEVIGNPEAGAWRPLWGRVSCYGFWGVVVVLTLTFSYSIVVEKNYEVGKLFPDMLTSLALIMATPLAILGVASYHRGIEKRVLAGEARTNPLNIFRRNSD